MTPSSLSNSRLLPRTSEASDRALITGQVAVRADLSVSDESDQAKARARVALRLVGQRALTPAMGFWLHVSVALSSHI